MKQQSRGNSFPKYGWLNFSFHFVFLSNSKYLNFLPFVFLFQGFQKPSGILTVNLEENSGAIQFVEKYLKKNSQLPLTRRLSVTSTVTQDHLGHICFFDSPEVRFEPGTSGYLTDALAIELFCFLEITQSKNDYKGFDFLQISKTGGHLDFQNWGHLDLEWDSHKACSCLLYTSPSPRDKRQSRMPSSA